jgi:hypothetical protein
MNLRIEFLEMTPLIGAYLMMCKAECVGHADLFDNVSSPLLNTPVALYGLPDGLISLVMVRLQGRECVITALRLPGIAQCRARPWTLQCGPQISLRGSCSLAEVQLLHNGI